MAGFSRGMRAGLAGVAISATAACGTLESSQGYVPTDGDLDAVVVGMDTRTTVRTIIGPPGMGGIVDDSGWYYVRSDYERTAWRAPVETDREVVSVSFDEDGVVSNIERFGLEDGQVIALSRRVTESNTQGIGFLQQLFGNLGQINPAQLLGGGPGSG